jgi:hypothetical protein
MTDVDVQFTLDCAGHGRLTLTSHVNSQLNAGYNASGSLMGPITVAPNSKGSAEFNVGPSVHDITGTVSGSFANGAQPIWHPSSHFEAHNWQTCGVPETTATTVLYQPAPSGGPVTTVPTPPTTVVPEAATTVPATTTTAVPAPTVARRETPVTTVHVQLPTTGSSDAHLVEGSASAVLLGIVLIGATLLRRPRRA